MYATVRAEISGLGSRASFRIQNVAFAAHCLQIDRIGWILLDLAPEPVDLHVDGALTAILAIVLGKLVPRDSHAGALGEVAQELAFALSEADGFAAAFQLAAADVKHESAHAHLAGSGRAAAAAKHVAHAQEKLARLERLGQIVVDAGLQPFNALLRLGTRRQHQDRDLGLAPERAGKLYPGFVRHHHVEYQQIEGEAAHGGARRRSIDGGGHAEAVLPQIAGEQIADAAVVVDDQNMRAIVVRRLDPMQFDRGCHRHETSAFPSPSGADDEHMMEETLGSSSALIMA